MEQGNRGKTKTVYMIFDQYGILLHSNISEESSERLIGELRLEELFVTDSLSTTTANKNYIVNHSRFVLDHKIYNHVLLQLKDNPLNMNDAACIDFFTKLYNRNLWVELLKGEISLPRAEKYQLILIDVDNLKEINDRFGHHIGDKSIKIISDSILNTIDTDQIAIRYGGDEFIILMPDRDSQGVDELVKQLELQIALRCKLKKYPAIEFSIGSSSFGSSVNLLSAFKRADKRMYKHKESKR